MNRLLCDVDDVLIDWMGAVNDVIERASGRRVTPKECGGWLDFNKQGFTKTELDYIKSELNAPGFTEELRPIPGVLDELKRVVAATDCHLAFVTAPWRSSETWHIERWRWLENNGFLGIRKDTSFVPTKDKWLVGPGLLVDDKIQNVIDYNKYAAGGRAVLWATVWNAVDPMSKKLQTVSTWEQVTNEVKKCRTR